ncbi:MAG: hypothetical protein ACLGHL_09170, partial [Actinomycetota bacterium]
MRVGTHRSAAAAQFSVTTAPHEADGGRLIAAFLLLLASAMVIVLGAARPAMALEGDERADNEIAREGSDDGEELSLGDDDDDDTGKDT